MSSTSRCWSSVICRAANSPSVSLATWRGRPRCSGVMELVLRAQAEPEIYSYENKKHFEEQDRRPFGNRCRRPCGRPELALSAWRGLGCRDAGRIGRAMRYTEAGTVNFLEANPLARLHPKDPDLPLHAAIERCAVPRPDRRGSSLQLLGRSRKGRRPEEYCLSGKTLSR